MGTYFMTKDLLKMHSLQELVDVVTRNKVKSIRTLEPFDRSPTDMLHDFYYRLSRNEFPDDASAAGFYGYSNEKDKAYRKQRNKLQQRLIDTSFFIDTSSPKFNSHQKAYYTCQKNLMAIRLLLARYARRSAIELIKDTIKKSDKYEFSEISAELYKLLRNHYANYDYSISRYQKYHGLAIHYREIAAAEDLVFEMYDSTSILSQKLIQNRSIIIAKCEEYKSSLIPILHKYKSFRLHLWSYFLFLRMEELKNNYEGVISICDSAIRFFKKKHFVSDQFIGVFYYHKLKSVIKMRDYKRAFDLTVKCADLFEENTIRWYTAQEYNFILKMHSASYQSAQNISDKVVRSTSFSQFMDIQEKWHLFRAYLYYLHLVKRTKVPVNSPITSFRIMKFMNQVPVFSMDKSGYNIPVLVIQILVQIHQKSYDHLNEKIVAIEKYTSRYLRKNDNYRSNCFIKMLLQIPKQNFDRCKVEKQTAKYLKKLEAMPLGKAKQAFEIEIIPYEDLWEMVLESIGTQRAKGKEQRAGGRVRSILRKE